MVSFIFEIVKLYWKFILVEGLINCVNNSSDFSEVALVAGGPVSEA